MFISGGEGVEDLGGFPPPPELFSPGDCSGGDPEDLQRCWWRGIHGKAGMQHPGIPAHPRDAREGEAQRLLQSCRRFWGFNKGP